MNTLIIGDLHAQMNNFEDTKSIFNLIKESIVGNNVDSVLFLGDIFHSHAVIRQEIGYFIKDEIKSISKLKPVYIIAGNHDGSSPNSVQYNSISLLLSEIDNVIVAGNENEPLVVEDLLLMPFMGDQQKMIDLCNKYSKDLILICHQTFDGAAYENKMLAPHGIDQKLINQDKIISGHIHTEQKIGKVWYPGSPRALNANEYNLDKGIFLYNTKTNESIKFSTNEFVKTFKMIEVIEGIDEVFEVTCNWKDKDDVRVTVTGSENYYNEFVEKNKSLLGRIKIIPNIKKKINSKLDIDSGKSSIEENFKKYIYEIYDCKNEERDHVWMKIQTILKETGINNTF